MHKPFWRFGRAAAPALLICCLLLAGPMAAEARTLKVLSAYPATHLFSKGCLDILKKNLAEVSGGKLELALSGPEVVRANEQFQPVQAGVFDMLFTHSVYHLGTTAMGVTTEAMAGDPDKRRQAGVIDFIDEQYKKHGMKLLAVLPAVEYNLVLRVPIGDRKPSLSGLKIRTPPAAAPMIKALGGAPVSLPPGEIYTSLQKGVIDGFTLVAVGLKDYKIHEVAKYLVRPTFGYISFSLFMNRALWDSLSDQERQWLTRAAILSERQAVAMFRQKHLEEVAELKKLGMEEVRLQPEDAARIESLYYQALWTVAEKKSGQPVKDLHELARDKGLTP